MPDTGEELTAVLYTLVVEGMRFHAFHGSLEVERELGQVLDISINFSYRAEPGEEDLPEKTFPYQKAYEIVQSIVMNTKFRTAEALALAISRQLLKGCPTGEFVQTTIKRGQLYVPGVLDHVGVTVEVCREDLED
ncbi:MAG TPA: dihydroneopterin aldolase [Synergistaceae bacterium]|nr:dihydroneopterin aldolase [Synergistaceae bacterium]HQH78223.1 dihydroneopterin aldolase [Synergistaceae bacterium]